MNLLRYYAYNPEDSDAVILDKIAISLIAGLCCIVGFIWTAMYVHFLGPVWPSFLPLLFTVVVGCFLFIGHFTKNHLWPVYGFIICILYIPAVFQWSIGGVFDAGYVLAWSLIAPLAGLMFLSFKKAISLLCLFLVNIIITVVFNDYFMAHRLPVTESVRHTFFVMNLSVSSVVFFSFSYYFVSSMIKERLKANNLLLNIFPRSVARTLKNNADKTIADRHHEVTVLFADLVGFTQFSTKNTPENVVSSLGRIFSEFDDLTEKYGLEKIKTIGDAYMVASGIPIERPNHAYAAVMLGFEMMEVLNRINDEKGENFSIRIGIHSGPVVAGVIGKTKFAYDLWGDTVNTASRMESHGIEGQVNISSATYQLVKNQPMFSFEKRENIIVKGKGEMEMYIVQNT
ncbi:MAG: adenylate/guanylate cyclase domain-containing protein [Schleiferiaceae bacterium]|nr:adenylate/guanylate cyclase domain-containing protein [Schleiferiaceae bacterium]